MDSQRLLPPLDDIYLGDCVEAMQLMPSASVDVVVTDPPYLTKYTPRDGRQVAGDAQSDWLYPAFREIYRLLKSDTFCVSFYGWPHADLFLRAWRRVGFRPVSHIVCLKRYSSRRGYTLGHHETVYLLAKGRPALPHCPEKDVLGWRYTGNIEHPTQKPVAVVRKLIEMFSKPDDVVLDPFAGSGTTGIAARACGRKFVLIEKETACFIRAKERLDEEKILR